MFNPTVRDTPATASDSDEPVWRRLIDSPPPTREKLISLLQEIVTNEHEVEVICRLGEDDAQDVINKMHKALDPPGLPQPLQGKCADALSQMCGHKTLLPGPLRILTCTEVSPSPLGYGQYAGVWEAKHEGHPVAIKIFRTVSDGDGFKEELYKRVVRWNALRHDNVLPVLGIMMNDKPFDLGPRYAMVSELMVNGNINQFIKMHRDANPFKLLQEAADGLIYLHNQKIIHGDLKGLNILIDKNERARLADFELQTTIRQYVAAICGSSDANPMRWMAPELYENLPVTKESDCYALGMVIYEVLAEQPPFKDTFLPPEILQMVEEGERPARPEGVKGGRFTDDVWGMLKLCWAKDTDSRPNIEAVRDCLKQASRALEPLPIPQANEGAKEEAKDLVLTISV